MGADVRPRLDELARNVAAPTTWRIVETGGPPEAALLTELAPDREPTVVRRLTRSGRPRRAAPRQCQRGFRPPRPRARDGRWTPCRRRADGAGVGGGARWHRAERIDSSRGGGGCRVAGHDRASAPSRRDPSTRPAGSLGERLYLAPAARVPYSSEERWTTTSSTASIPQPISPTTWPPTSRSDPLPSPRAAYGPDRLVHRSTAFDIAHRCVRSPS